MRFKMLCSIILFISCTLLNFDLISTAQDDIVDPLTSPEPSSIGSCQNHDQCPTEYYCNSGVCVYNRAINPPLTIPGPFGGTFTKEKDLYDHMEVIRAQLKLLEELRNLLKAS